MTIFTAGSVSDKIEDKYIKEATSVMEYIIQTDSKVICCTDNRGIIGSLYRQIEGKGRVILTVPKIYLKYVGDIQDNIEIVTKTINQRTDICIEKADVMLFFPGGIGTIYELFSCLETKKGGEHHKPIIIVNYFGYYDDILNQLEKGYQEKIIEMDSKESYWVADTSEEVIKYLKMIQIDKKE